MSNMTTLRILKDGDVWAIQLTPEFIVSGFLDQGDAAVWLMEYIFRSLNELKTADLAKQREEVRKQILGAAILAEKLGKETKQ